MCTGSSATIAPPSEHSMDSRGSPFSAPRHQAGKLHVISFYLCLPVFWGSAITVNVVVVINNILTAVNY